MSLRKFTLAMLGFVFLACGAHTPPSSKRTLTGISQDQVMVSAQHTLAQKGLDTEKISFENGEIQSAWDGRNKRQLQYKVKVSPSSESGSEVETLVIEVSANAREKVVGGWSEPAPASSNDCDDVLDDIVDMAVGRFGEGGGGGGGELAASTASAKCASTSECPEGTHCGSGKCVSECAAEGDCEPGKFCDDRGRCVKPEPEPCPEIPPPLPQEDEGKDKKKKRRDHND